MDMAIRMKSIPFHEERKVASKDVARKAVFEEIGKYFLDVSKLIFGGVILAGVMNLEVDKIVLFSIGGFAVIFTILVGLYLFKLGKE